MIRKTDSLGRLVLPMELRRSLGINRGDSLTISVDEDRIILDRHQEGCIICGGTKRIADFKGKGVCRDCLFGIIANADYMIAELTRP